MSSTKDYLNMNKKRILIVSSASYSLTNFRRDFINALISNGYEVFTASPDLRADIAETLVAMGVKPIEFNLSRTGINPYIDIKSIFQLKTIIKENCIDLVFPYTIKPVLYGSIAANLCKVPVISLITGLGFTFSAASIKARLLQHVTTLLYKVAIQKNRLIIFQNSDDQKLFLDSKIISPNNKTDVVGGSGVNLREYSYRINENASDKVKFIFVARLIKEKGVDLFIEAATKLKTKYPCAEFYVIGSPGNSPSAIKEEKLNLLHKNGIIIYLGHQDDIQQNLANGDVFVLPTYYREGIPRSILEALSVGLPIITTETPGCRETVIPYKNGILVKPQDLDELTNAMEYFLLNKDEIKQMGIESRKFAEKRFDVNIINNTILQHIAATI